MKTWQPRLARTSQWALVWLTSFALTTLLPATSRPQEPASKPAAAGGEPAAPATAPGAHASDEKSPGAPADGAAAYPRAASVAPSVTPTLGAPPASKEGCPLCPVSNKDEVQVLMRLRERHTLLAARENVVAQKEAALSKMEESLDAQLTQYDAAMTKMEARLGVGEARKLRRDAQIKTLIDTLQGLSAKKAAPMLSEANPDFVAELFRQLGSARVASLLAVMPPSKAGKLIDLAVEAAPKPPAKKKPAPPPPAKTDAPPAEGDPANPGE